MQSTLVGGVSLVVVGVLGYVVGTFFAYPGRAFTVTAVMVGITLVAISDGRIVGRRAQ